MKLLKGITPKLETRDVALVSDNLDNNEYQQDLRVFYLFVSNLFINCSKYQNKADDFTVPKDFKP